MVTITLLIFAAVISLVIGILSMILGWLSGEIFIWSALALGLAAGVHELFKNQ